MIFEVGVRAQMAGRRCPTWGGWGIDVTFWFIRPQVTIAAFEMAFPHD